MSLYLLLNDCEPEASKATRCGLLATLNSFWVTQTYTPAQGRKPVPPCTKPWLSFEQREPSWRRHTGSSFVWILHMKPNTMLITKTCWKHYSKASWRLQQSHVATEKVRPICCSKDRRRQEGQDRQGQTRTTPRRALPWRNTSGIKRLGGRVLGILPRIKHATWRSTKPTGPLSMFLHKNLKG